MTKDKSFAEKYGLSGKGHPVIVSKRTKEYATALLKQSEAYVKLSEAAPFLNNTRYGA